MPSADKLEWPQGEPLFETQWRAVSESLAGNGIVSAGDLQLSAGTANREVTWAAGTVFYVGSEYSTTSGSTTVSTGDGTYDRWDTVAFDTGTSSVVVHEGTPAANPEPPDVSGGEVLLGVLYVPQNFDDVFTADQILNWRALFSNEAEEVHFDDPTGDYGVSNVEAALDAIDLDFVRGRDNTITGQLGSLGTNPGAFGAVLDAVIDGNSAAGTAHSFTFALDANTLVEVYAESDGAGGVQNLRVDLPQLVRVGNDIVTTGSTTIWDSANGVVPQAQLGGPASSLTSYPLPIGDLNSPFALPSITDMDAAGNDLTDSTVGVTVWDTSAGHVPRPQVDDHVAVTTQTASDTNGSYLTSDEELVGVDTATNATTYTVTLASADAMTGNRLRVMDIGGAAADYPITIDTEGTETINGASSVTIAENYAAKMVTWTGSEWSVTSSVTSGAGVSPFEDFSGAETGNVAAGDQGVLIVSSLDPDETVEVYRAVLTTATVQAVPSSVDLKLVTFDNAGAFSTQATIAAGDGSTIYDDLTGDPLASYTNTGTSAVSIGVLVDNGTTSGVNIVSDVEGRTGL